MEENRRSTRTLYQKRCSHIPFQKIGWLTYRCWVVTGIAAAIILMMNNYGHEQLQLLTPPVKWTDYVVYNPSCKIPEYPKNHEDVLPYLENKSFSFGKRRNCSSSPLLTSVTRSNRSSPYILNLHRSYATLYTDDKLVCCYSTIHTNNEKHTIGECQTVETSIALNSTADLVAVTCKDNLNRTIYRMHHFLVPEKAEVGRKLERFKKDKRMNDEFLSVMLVGLDSVSRLNLLRSMPETVKYMENNGWYTFPAYHKIQRNTLYNLNGPVLTGLSGHQLKQTCWPDESNHLDSCPYIWKTYSERNYITAYGEDSPMWDSFKYAGFDGFKKQPTDYYLRPHMKVLDSTLNPEGSFDICVGLVKAADYILDFAADFASTFVSYPTFSLFWMNSGHEDLNGPQMLDQRFIAYFKSLESAGVLNRSMIVFLSDHGFQKAGFRSTYMGFVEDAMPFLYVWFPQWYRNKYPSKVKNLVGNKNRLVSHYDLHLTLMDVLGLKTNAPGCPKCVSLFSSVPWNRGCPDAGIIPEDCACDNFVAVPVDSFVRRMGDLVAARINALAATYAKYLMKGFKCSIVRVTSVHQARREVTEKGYFGQKYFIHVNTDNGAILEAVVLSDTLEVKSIVEFSHFQQRSHCMNSREGKRWCTCENE